MQTTADSKPLSNTIRAKMEQYRENLLAFGMQEPSKRKSSVWHWLFYKPITEQTAFVVNFKGTDSCIEVAYGYATTAFTKLAGAENDLNEWGVSDEHITIREKCVICNENDEKNAKHRIGDMYTRYFQTQKDDLLTSLKEKRKEFIQQIAQKLKPYGFKKKANTWSRFLDSEYYLMFNVQKSNFSDEYFFNIYIGKNGTNHYGDCYYTRIAPKDMYPMDWQTVSKSEFACFLDETAIPALETIINTPLNELGKIQSYWHGCYCDRKICDYCWMVKNIWETKV